MQLRRESVVALYLLLLLRSYAAAAHNVTRMLEGIDSASDFSTFNHCLTVTHLAPEINRRQTITVCVVDNAGMADLLSKNLTIGVIRNVLSLHVLLDYYDAKKLHQINNGSALAATMFQATGTAPGSSGFVRITDLKGGKVGFSSESNTGNVSATFVKPIQAEAYNISIIQISNILPSSEAEAPAPSQVNLTALMSAHGCKAFADALSANPAQETFESNVESGVTVFCPGDEAMKNFMPKFRNLSADGKQSLFEYHGMPIYESLSGLQSNNGPTNTLATNGARKFDFTVQNDGTDVTIKTGVVTAMIVNTVVDKDPVAMYELDGVLMPPELFKSSLPPAPAPAPAPTLAAPKGDAAPPKSSSKNHKSPPTPAAGSDSPADAPADSNSAVKSNGGEIGAAFLSLLAVLMNI